MLSFLDNTVFSHLQYSLAAAICKAYVYKKSAGPTAKLSTIHNKGVDIPRLLMYTTDSDMSDSRRETNKSGARLGHRNDQPNNPVRNGERKKKWKQKQQQP